jgi:hypothetical protein
VAAGDARAVPPAGLGVQPDQQVLGRAHLLHRHLHHHARLRVDGQEGGVGRAAVGAEGRQDHAAHLLVPLGHAQQRGVEPA